MPLPLRKGDFHWRQSVPPLRYLRSAGYRRASENLRESMGSRARCMLRSPSCSISSPGGPSPATCTIVTARDVESSDQAVRGLGILALRGRNHLTHGVLSVLYPGYEDASYFKDERGFLHRHAFRRYGRLRAFRHSAVGDEPVRAGHRGRRFERRPRAGGQTAELRGRRRAGCDHSR